MDLSLHELGEALGLPVAFDYWCRSRGVRDLDRFLQMPLGLYHDDNDRLWADVQLALLQAMRHARQGDAQGARQVLGTLLDRPEFSRGSVEALERIGFGVPTVRHRPRHSRGPSAREVLVSLGGIASARAIADRLGELTGTPVSVRTVRDRLRHARGAVRKLGAGYFALGDQEAQPVLRWAENWLAERGEATVDELVDAILAAYPHGHRLSITAWAHQEPGRIRLRGERVSLRRA